VSSFLANESDSYVSSSAGNKVLLYWPAKETEREREREREREKRPSVKKNGCRKREEDSTHSDFFHRKLLIGRFNQGLPPLPLVRGCPAKCEQEQRSLISNKGILEDPSRL
jgi:hypothetical protein